MHNAIKQALSVFIHRLIVIHVNLLRNRTMKSNAIVSLCLSSLLAFSSPALLAETFKSQPGQMYKVLTSLKAKGYVIVKHIEFDDSNGEFKAVVVNAEGKNLDLKINPKTGQMSKEKGDITGWTAIEIAKKVQDAGYKNIYDINTEILIGIVTASSNPT